jgi:hypothetical protein
MSGASQVHTDRRRFMAAGLGFGTFAVLAGVGDKLLANRSFADFIAGVSPRSSWRDRINAGLAECAAAAKPVIGSAGTYPLDGPLHIPAGVQVACEEGCIVQKAYDDTGMANALLLTAGDQATTADDFQWQGGEFRPADASLGRGNLATLIGFGWSMRGAVMRDWRDGQCFMFGGGGYEMSSIDARSGQRKTGTGTYRCIWNEPRRPSVCSNLLGIGGDDIFQCVPLSTPDHPLFGRDIGGLTYENCYGRSHVARLIAALIVRGKPENSDLLRSRITDCTWRNVNGQGGHRSIVFENSFGDTDRGSRIENLLVENSFIDCSQERGTVSDSVRLWSDRNGLGRIHFHNCRIEGSRTPLVMRVDGVEELVIDGNSRLAGRGQIIRAGGKHPVGRVSLSGTNIVTDRRGSRPAVWLNLEDGLTTDQRLLENGAPLPADAIQVVRGRRLSLGRY